MLNSTSAWLYSMGMPALLVVGTTVFILIFNSTAGIIGYFFIRELDIPLIIQLGIDAVLGAYLGQNYLKN